MQINNCICGKQPEIEIIESFLGYRYEYILSCCNLKINNLRLEESIKLWNRNINLLKIKNMNKETKKMSDNLNNDDWHEVREKKIKYKCPECNTPLNESMFCVKCCSKWTKSEPEKEKQEETLDNFLEGFINFVDGLGCKKKKIEDDEIEWSDIDGITNLPKTSNQLAEEHWKYIESLLKAHGEDDELIEQIGFHYRSAFIHGYKHAVEDK